MSSDVTAMVVICRAITKPASPGDIWNRAGIDPTRKGIMNRLPSPRQIAAIMPIRAGSNLTGAFPGSGAEGKSWLAQRLCCRLAANDHRGLVRNWRHQARLLQIPYR